MKKKLFALCAFLFSYSSFSQNHTKEYSIIKQKGDSLYKAGDYINAANNFSRLLRLSGEKLTIWDWNRPAFSWALAGNKDSAFYFLDGIANMDTIKFVDYIDLVDDRDYNSIRNEPRWKLYNEKILNIAKKTFYTSLKTSDEKIILDERKWLAVAWTYNREYDSAFHELDLLAGSRNMNYAVAMETITNGYFMQIQNDKRWSEFKSKIYSNVVVAMSSELRKPGAKITNQSRREVAIAWININKPDSAFYQLNLIAGSPDLTFEDVFFIITDGEFSNVSKVSDFKPLENDPRWTLLKDKFFIGLHNRYFNDKSFATTKKSAKRLMIDGGHFNLHDIEDTYAPLAGALRYSRIEAFGLKGKFDKANLANADIVIISNPNPDRQDSIALRAQRAKEPVRWSAAATLPGYTNDEVAAIHHWVKNGGSLLLILDHAPFGKVGETLAAAFGIENRNAGTYDPLNRDPAVDTTQATTLLFTRSKGLIGKHSIMNGVDRVTTYTGESLVGPPGSDALLLIPATATDLDWLPETRQFRNRSAAGRSQGVAFNYGKGRVVMLGEAAITRPNSLSRTDSDNWKLMLNILRWLAKEKMD